MAAWIFDRTISRDRSISSSRFAYTSTAFFINFLWTFLGCCSEQLPILPWHFALTFCFQVPRLTRPGGRAPRPIKFYHLIPLDLRKARHISTSALWIFTCCIDKGQLSIQSPTIALGASAIQVKSVFWEWSGTAKLHIGRWSHRDSKSKTDMLPIALTPGQQK